MKDKISKFEDFESLYDLIKSGEDQLEPDEEVLKIFYLESRYDSLGNLDEGAMKRVDMAFDLLCHRTVAKAELKTGKADLFINEARTLAKLEHSSIVPLYDIGINEDGVPYFTMRKLGGENFEKVLASIRKNDESYIKEYHLGRLLEIFLKVCDVVAYAHSQKTLHLDIKPSNIQINEFGEVFLCDWGLSRNAEDLIKMDMVRGTLGYMAPEQIDPDVGTINYTTDIYSLGSLLYTMLTLHAPVQADNFDDAASIILKGEIEEPQFKVKTPAGLNAITMKSLSVDQSQRYQDVSDLANDVRSFIHGYATKAEDPSFFKILALMLVRYKRVFCLVFLALVAATYFVYKLNLEKNKAMHALDASVKSEHKAISSNKQMLEEKAKRLELTKDSLPRLMNLAKKDQGGFNFEGSRALTKYILGIAPDHQFARFLNAYSQFGAMNFEESLRLLNQYTGENNVKWLKEKSAAYKGRLLTIDEVVEIFSLFINNPPSARFNLHWNLVNTVTEKYPLKDRILLAKKISTRKKGGTFYCEPFEDGLSLSLKRINQQNIFIS